MKPDLRNLLLNELEQYLLDMGEPKFRARQIFSWVQKRGIGGVDGMTDLGSALREKLNEHFQISTLEKLKVVSSSDGTKKYLWGLWDGAKIESVLLTDEGRRTICLSTQVGCRMNCGFCATARIKFRRNLTAGEIVSQVIQIESENGPISNLVYMGMGEPLDNYDNVLKSIRILNHPLGKNIGARHITLSTCGLIPAIKKLAQEKLQIRLAVSLNSPNDAERNKLMPVNKKYPLKDLLTAVRDYTKITNRRVTIEYVLMAGQNDSTKDAQALAKVLKGLKVNLNLIPFNAFSQSEFNAPDKKTIQSFKNILEREGFEVTQRYRRGEDIGAACGQLGGEA